MASLSRRLLWDTSSDFRTEQSRSCIATFAPEVRAALQKVRRVVRRAVPCAGEKGKGRIDEPHLVVAPVLLGQGESLVAGVDAAALGFRCVEHVVLHGELPRGGPACWSGS